MLNAEPGYRYDLASKLVDATWQDGSSAVCGSLSAGLPLVMYDGYVARELMNLGIPGAPCRIVPLGDHTAFGRELIALTNLPRSRSLAAQARRFAGQRLDFQTTGPATAKTLRAVLAGGS